MTITLLEGEYLQHNFTSFEIGIWYKEKLSAYEVFDKKLFLFKEIK